MKRQNATTAKELPRAEREAKLASLVSNGRISPERARLIDFREPSLKARVFGKTLASKAKQFLAGNRRAAA
jgi:hypothetical protein